MALTLPDEAHAGDSGHVKDHNDIVAAITALEAQVAAGGTAADTDMNFRGDFVVNAAEQYAKGDIVRFGGTVWIANMPTTGASVPVNPTWEELLPPMGAGAVGPAGPEGPAGPAGPKGDPGDSHIPVPTPADATKIPVVQGDGSVAWSAAPTGGGTGSAGGGGVDPVLFDSLFESIGQQTPVGLWDASATYSGGDVVLWRSQTWVAVGMPFNGPEPGIDQTKWQNISIDYTARVAQNARLHAEAAWVRWTGTQAEYDAIATKDPNTLYVVA
jgi:hypothetical protein